MDGHKGTLKKTTRKQEKALNISNVVLMVLCGKVALNGYLQGKTVDPR